MANNTYSFEKNKLLQPISKLIGITARITMPVLINVLIELGPEYKDLCTVNYPQMSCNYMIYMV